MSLAILFHYR